MKVLKIFIPVVFLLCCFDANSRGEEAGFNKEDLLENLLEAPSLENSEDFKMLGYLADEVLIEIKVDLTNQKRSILTQAAEIIEKSLPRNPPDNQQEEIRKISKMVQRCSDLENNIWLIIKIRRLHDQRKQDDNKLAEKPHKLQ